MKSLKISFDPRSQGVANSVFSFKYRVVMDGAMSKLEDVFADYAEQIFGPAQRIFQIEATDGGPDVQVYVYPDVPREGLTTCITFGLSCVEHEAWEDSKPELILTIASERPEWAIGTAFVAANFRGLRDFRYGEILPVDGELAADTHMRGFVTSECELLDIPPPHLDMHEYLLSFVQINPIHESEKAVIESMGLRDFMRYPTLDIRDPRRKPVSLIE